MSNVQAPSQSSCYTFQSSSVSYGGANGAYYTKSMTRRAGSDGVSYMLLVNGCVCNSLYSRCIYLMLIFSGGI